MLNDHSNDFLVKSILLNNRLEAYAHYIDIALQNGYHVEPLGAFYKHFSEEGKHFVLRHDVDHKGKATRKMFECEKALGVKSTYYFRKSTIDKQLIDEMISAGFEVGFHFETIADYIEEKDITDKRDIDFLECRKRLALEIRQFEVSIGHKISSICSHGAPANVRLGVSSNALVEDGIPPDCPAEFEAYDRAMYEYVDCHIMDGSLLFNYGFSYRNTPLSAIRAEVGNIVFLAHPNHWYLSPKERVLQLRAFLLGKATYSTEREFSRIEK